MTTEAIILQIAWTFMEGAAPLRSSVNLCCNSYLTCVVVTLAVNLAGHT